MKLFEFEKERPMTKFRFALTAFAVTAFIALASSSASAISKTAANGEISTLDPGGFGAVTITKSITIEGSQGQGYGSILATGTNGVVVNDSLTGAPGTIIVSLRNLSINGAASTNASSGLVGILIVSAKVVHVEGCTIQGFKSSTVNAGRGISD